MVEFKRQYEKPAPDNVLVKNSTIALRINRYYTSVDGEVLDKNSNLIPDTLKTQFPFYLFGAFDLAGGYSKCLEALPPDATSPYLMTFIYGVNAPFLSFTGFNTINSRLSIGDIVHIFTDNISNPNIFVWIVISSAKASFASIIDNTKTLQNDFRVNQIRIKDIDYLAPENQYAIPFHFIMFDNIGAFRTDQIQPYTYKDAFVALNDFINMQIRFDLDQYIAVGSYMLFSTDLIQINFNLKTS
jgi:hypothetical protein